MPPPDPDRPLKNPPTSPFHPSRTSTTLSKHRSNPNLRPYPLSSPAAAKDFPREVRLRRRTSYARLDRIHSAPSKEELGTDEDEIMESASEEEDVFVSPSVGYRYGKKSLLRGAMSMSNLRSSRSSVDRSRGTMERALLGSPIRKQATRRGSSAVLLNGHNDLTNNSTPRSSTFTNLFKSSDPFASSASYISGFGSATDSTLTSPPSSSSSSSFSSSSSESAVSDSTVKPRSFFSPSSESSDEDDDDFVPSQTPTDTPQRTITQQPTPSTTTPEDRSPISNQPSSPSWETHLPSPRASEDDRMDAIQSGDEDESQSDETVHHQSSVISTALEETDTNSQRRPASRISRDLFPSLPTMNAAPPPQVPHVLSPPTSSSAVLLSDNRFLDLESSQVASTGDARAQSESVLSAFERELRDTISSAFDMLQVTAVADPSTSPSFVDTLDTQESPVRLLSEPSSSPSLDVNDNSTNHSPRGERR
ncbi:hypothetical protein L198_01296 [Cryptococcus wingfieldii CBS 7118]|uniref:Uncharacterized protein n=1 Tax=Cryptococcus wingfieldii CBS 7118 TaxID=1295528 RepID=A0A1E3K0P9_9TREE|nr:hypothetical protein L198_01296 [Cryptococcus wingfieldii CBS 7118]ODO06067.1 hypothetical protein L198_01296 [Cryptococcus wingfieldii CBS 7118]